MQVRKPDISKNLMRPFKNQVPVAHTYLFGVCMTVGILFLKCLTANNDILLTFQLLLYW